MAPKTRLDAWSHQEDVLLKDVVIQHITTGSTQLKAFDEVGERLGRTSAAVSFRYRKFICEKFKKELSDAKKQRLDLKRENRNGVIESKNKEQDRLTSQLEEVFEESQPKSVNELEVKEYKGQRVVTFKDVDVVHRRIEGTAKRNFYNNKHHLIEGEDYFNLSYEEVRGTNFVQRPNSQGLTVFTESGYLMLVKSFTDDLSWEVQRELVNNYFKLKNNPQHEVHSYMIEDPIKRAEKWIQEQRDKLMLEQRVAENEPKVTYYDKILQSKGTMTVTQIAKDYGITAQKLNKILHQEGVQYKVGGQWLLYAKHADQGFTKSESYVDETETTRLNTKWTQKGRLFIHNILTNLGYDPDDLVG